MTPRQFLKGNIMNKLVEKLKTNKSIITHRTLLYGGAAVGLALVGYAAYKAGKVEMVTDIVEAAAS